MPPDLEFLTHIKDEPIALVIAFIIVLYKPAGVFFDFVIQWVIKLFKITPKKKKMSVEEMLRDDAEKRENRQKEYDERFEKIESRLESLVSIMEDYEESANKTSIETHENKLFNETLAPFKRLKAFRFLIAKKKNGRIKDKGMELILKNKETWLDVQDVEMNLEIVDQKYYDDVINEIDRRIMRG